MATKEVFSVVEEALPENDEVEVPEVEVRGDEAVIRVHRPERVEERRVRLPKTTWG